MKKLLLFFMITLLPVLGNAQTLIDGIYYDLNSSDNTASVTNNSNGYYSGCVVIPEKVFYEGATYSVTSIGNDAFNNCTNLTHVSIPNSVTSIESGAFGKTNLRTLIVGTGVQRFSDQSFSGATRPIKTIWLTNTPPENYSVAQGIVNYVANSQYGSLSNSIEYKYLNSMFNVDGFTYVPVSPSERTCDVIDCIYNESKTEVIIDGAVSYQDINMKVLSVQPYTFYQNVSLQTINLESAGSIGMHAFDGCINLKTVTLGDNITGIGEYAFSECSRLEGIIVPNSIKEIGQYAFFKCIDMTSATIGDSTEYIDQYAFSECTQLASVIIGNGTKTIGQYAFSECTQLASVIIGNGTKTIGQYAFARCSNLVSVSMGNSLRLIEPHAFTGCFSLFSITIPGSTHYIADYAFEGCTGLQKVIVNDHTINEEITTFEDKYVHFYINLRSATVLTAFVSEGDELSFDYSDSKGANIRIDTPSESYTYTDKNKGTIIHAFHEPGRIELRVEGVVGTSVPSYVNIKNIKLKKSHILALGSSKTNSLFADSPLDSIYMGRNICYGISPFNEKKSLRKVVVNSNDISANEFYGCCNLEKVQLYDGVTSIGDKSFTGCSSIKTFSFGKKIKYIGKEAFSDCTALTQLISNATTPPFCGDQALDGINKWTCKLFVPWGCMNAYQTADQWKEFFFIEERGYYPIVNGIRYSIISDKDARVAALENGEKYSGDIVIPESITVLGHDLKITSIDQYAFQDCMDLTSVSIPNSVTSIGERAFYGCSSLVSVIALPEIPPYLENNSFSDYSAQLIVPKGCKEAYQQAQGWSQFKNITEIIIGTNFLQNVESGLFITAANDWGTRASVDETGISFVIAGIAESGYTLDTRVYEKDTYHYLNVADDGNIYCDQPACNLFFKEVSNGIYALTKDNQKYIAYDGSSSVLTLSDNANDPKAQWWIVTEEMRKAELSKATEAAPLNATFLLPDANFSRHNQQGNWQDNPTKDGENTNMNGSKSDANFDVYQEITGVPNGIYVVKMQGFYREGANDEVAEMHQNGTEHLYAQFYVNEEGMPVKSIFDEAGKNGSVGKSTQLGYIPNSQSHASSYFDRGLYEHELKVAVEDGTLRIGVRKQTDVSNDWTCFDNFRLFYYGTNAPFVGIEQIDSEQGTTDNAPKSIYDLSGRKLQNLQRGVNILRMNDGTTRKVLKK